jgi:hypothetical protein
MTMMARIVSPSAAGIAGNVATGLFLLVGVLQVLLALGILPVTMAWGGAQSALTPSLRIASLAAAVILGAFALVIRRRAGLSGSGQPSTLIRILSWVITAFLALNTLGNFASSSRGEALVFGPLSLALALACLLVSLSRSAGEDS